MASFLAAGYQLAASSTDFFDDDNGNLHEDAINALAHRGSPKGVQRGATAPAPGGRDQMASFLGRAEGLTASKPPVRRIAWQLYRADGSCSLMVNGKRLSRRPACSEDCHGRPTVSGSSFPWATISGLSTAPDTTSPSSRRSRDLRASRLVSRRLAHRLHALGRRRRPRRSLSGGRRRRRRDAAQIEHLGPSNQHARLVTERRPPGGERLSHAERRGRHRHSRSSPRLD